MAGMKISREEDRDGVIHFELDGLLDSDNFESLESLFDKYFKTGVYRFVVDLRRLQYVSSAGAGVFIGSLGTCQDNDGDIVLVQPSQEVREIFEMLGVYQIFPVVQSQLEATAFFAKKVV